MKVPGTQYWNSPNTGATNESGFSALPGGSRTAVGYFSILGGGGFWWSSTEVEQDSFHILLVRLIANKNERQVAPVCASAA